MLAQSVEKFKQFVKKLFDALVTYINRVVITFENTSALFYFYM